MLKRPPHILVTTPESLYILLTAAKSREILTLVETVVSDEITRLPTTNEVRTWRLARATRGSHHSLAAPHRSFRYATAGPN